MNAAFILSVAYNKYRDRSDSMGILLLVIR